MINSIRGARYNSDKYHKLFEKGRAFTFSDYYTFSAHEVKDFLADITTLVNYVHSEALVPTIIAGGGPLTLDIYSGVTADADGSVLQGFNRNGDFYTEMPEMKLTLGTTITDLGTRFSGIPIPGSSTGAFSTSSIVPASLPFRPISNTKILMRLTNTDNASALVGFRLNWFEY